MIGRGWGWGGWGGGWKITIARRRVSMLALQNNGRWLICCSIFSPIASLTMPPLTWISFWQNQFGTSRTLTVHTIPKLRLRLLLFFVWDATAFVLRCDFMLWRCFEILRMSWRRLYWDVTALEFSCVLWYGVCIAIHVLWRRLYWDISACCYGVCTEISPCCDCVCIWIQLRVLTAFV